MMISSITFTSTKRALPKIDAALMDIARKFLQEKGAWPAAP